MTPDMTDHQVRMLQTATAHMTPADREAFHFRVRRLLTSWGRCPPDMTDHVLSQAITAVRVVDDARARGVEAVNAMSQVIYILAGVSAALLAYFGVIIVLVAVLR